jgi:hypothetical protein
LKLPESLGSVGAELSRSHSKKMENAYLAYQMVAGIVLTVVAFVQKIGFKKRLSKGLGRKVSDQELLSISAWMKATTDEKK